MPNSSGENNNSLNITRQIGRSLVVLRKTDASAAIRSHTSLTKDYMIDMTLDETEFRQKDLVFKNMFSKMCRFRKTTILIKLAPIGAARRAKMISGCGNDAFLQRNCTKPNTPLSVMQRSLTDVANWRRG